MTKTLELYEKIQNYNGPKLVFIISGGGVGITDLVKVIGASKIIHAIQIPYDSDEAVRFVTQNIRLPLPDGLEPLELENIKFVSEDWAKHLCNAALTEYSGSDCRVFVVTAGITTNRYRKGENHAWIATGTTSKNIETHHLQLTKLTEEDHQKFFPGYVDWKRGSEDREITNFVLDLVFNIPKEIEKKFSTSSMDFESSYKALVENQGGPFVCKADGTIVSLQEHFSSGGMYDVIPGSFNPLHDTHREIFENIPKVRIEKTKVCFEISIERIGKENLSLEEMQTRVGQFKNYADVLITRAPRFIEKIGILSSYTKNICFHVGIDTISRMKLDYTPIGIQALNAKFAVYHRFIDGKVCSLTDEFEKVPNNCMMTPINRSLESMKRSSTEIRNNNNKPSTIPSALTRSTHMYSLADVKGL